MNNQTVPIIRMELQGMKQSIIHAFHDHQMRIDEDVKKAVEAFCSSGVVEDMLTKEVHRVMNEAIRDEVNSFFRYSGEGRKIVAEAVRNRLINKETYTAVDGLGDE